MPLPTNPGTNNVSAARVSQLPDDDLGQPEQELTPQVSVNESESRDPSRAPEVERGAAAPSTFEPISGQETPALSEIPAPSSVDASQVPVPDSEEGLYGEHVLLASEAVTGNPDVEPELLTFTTLHVSESSEGPPLAEDNLPYVESPLECAEGQAFCVEIPLKPRDVQKWAQESSPEQLATLATVGKRARVEVRVKDLSREEVALFDQAKQKELQCWIQTSAIKNILRSKLNPSQILKSRWILTWKAPEPGETKKRAKARLVVLGFQDPKLVEVMRDAPTLSREGRATVLQTIASCRFPLSSFDIKTAFLRGKADEGNPLAMEPPPELRKLLNLPESEVCQLVGNAYGRVDAPLLFYKELCKQLKLLGFTVHPLEPCVFLLKTGSRLHGILGVHVDDGVCGGDEHFLQKIESLQKILPFGSRKHQSFIFTGIQLEQLPDYSIRASQSEYVHRIPQIDIGRNRRQFPEAAVNEEERTKLRGLIGSVQYAVTHTRPDIAARLGELQCQTTTATVQTLLLANKVLREAQEHHQVCIFFQSIPVERLTFVAFGDASFASSKNLNSHQGVLICATNDQLNQNLEAPISPLTWSSKKIPRVVRSTLSAEAYAMSKAVDLLGWVRALWGVIHVPEFQWQKPESGFRQLRTAIIVTDCKSLFDLVTRLAMPACEEYRTTLEVLLIKQRCLENACFRWENPQIWMHLIEKQWSV
ncbi:Copia protein [Symbiodinium microadriaticum]|uniref:Copia protein n=1 Tax=Symbiodinium microadriaticum TaxID=2951 RepID=A0A1Q9C4S6_SYMMI|nr:Copia protein [Symbiodinium microadriaticum]